VSEKRIRGGIKDNEHQVELQLADDGKGFNLSDKHNEKDAGLGLRNMHNRAQLIAATFSMKSEHGKGTAVNIVLPNGS